MPSPAPWSIQTRWSPAPQDVSRARRLVVDRLLTAGLAESVDAAALIVTELATNAVRHAGSPFRVTLSYEGSQLRVEVYDESDLPAALRSPQDERPGGRGLHLVGAFSTDWGVIPHGGGGKTVWATLPRAGDQEGLSV